MDMKLIQGLLVAACVSLVVAISFTVADLLQYTGIQETAGAMARPPAAAERPAVPAAPAPAPAAAGGAPAEAAAPAPEAPAPAPAEAAPTGTE